jgi:hypothetical protein
MQEYLKHKEFKLLVRLVVGTKEYTNLQYILDILVKYDCFELILATKKTFTEDSNDLKELQMALYFFLKLRYPQHTHLLKLLFLSFKMYREYADFFLGKVRMQYHRNLNCSNNNFFFCSYNSCLLHRLEKKSNSSVKIGNRI